MEQSSEWAKALHCCSELQSNDLEVERRMVVAKDQVGRPIDQSQDAWGAMVRCQEKQPE